MRSRSRTSTSTTGVTSSHGPGWNKYGPVDLRAPCVLWVPPKGIDELATFASFWGNPNMFEDAFELHEFEPGVPFEAAGMEVVAHRLPHYTLEAYGFRAAHDGKTLVFRRLGTVPRDRRPGARRRPVRL